MTERASDRPDVQALTILLTRLIQAISEILIKLVEYQTGPNLIPKDVAINLSDQMIWVGEVIRTQFRSEDTS